MLSIRRLVHVLPVKATISRVLFMCRTPSVSAVCVWSVRESFVPAPARYLGQNSAQIDLLFVDLLYDGRHDMRQVKQQIYDEL